MRNVKYLLVTFFSFFFLAIFAQKPFTGKIVYEVSLEGEVSPITASAVPEKIVTTIRDGVVREDIMGQTTIYDGHKKTLTSFIEGGKRKAVVQTLNHILSKEKIAAVTIQDTPETKEISGFLCKKSVISYFIDDKEVVQSVYYTPEIDVGEAYQLRTVFRDVSGFPLEYEMYMKGARLLFKAIEVKEEKVNKRLFEIPKGYEIFRVE